MKKNRSGHARRAHVAAAGAMALSMAVFPASAIAADASIGTTEVTVQANSDAMLAFRVPTLIPFYAAADGTLTGPSPEVCRIENLSVFGIHVTNVTVNQQGNWTIQSDAAEGAVENAMDFQFGPSLEIDAAAALNGCDISGESSFNMRYAGSGDETINLKTSGNVARVTNDLSSPKKTASIVWTVAPGMAGE